MEIKTVTNLSVNAVRTHGIPTRYSPLGKSIHPTIFPNHRLIGVLKAGGPKGSEFAVDVTNELTYQTAICSLGQIRGVNTRMDLYQVPKRNFRKVYC